ncbi:MAG TPA: hypothetical protein VFR58_07610 [Flavisolibacter sp.]|nr:hypothetical protein [Flavisolibacter sp.]
MNQQKPCHSGIPSGIGASKNENEASHAWMLSYFGTWTRMSNDVSISATIRY